MNKKTDSKGLNGAAFAELDTVLKQTATPPKKGRGRPSKQDKAQEIAAVKGTARQVQQDAPNAPPVQAADTFQQTSTLFGSVQVLNPSINVKMFQIYFKAEQKKKLDPDMIHFDNSRRKNHLLEYDVFRRLAASDQVHDCDYWGALSWKFGEVMGFGAAAMKAFIAKNPGYDIYFCNPHPTIEGVYENMWVQGEISHPNFMQLSREFMQAAGLDESALNRVVPANYMASANYFVASTAFWKEYLVFIDTALERAEQNLSQDTLALLLSPVADNKGLHNGANYVPFIVERLLTEFLISNMSRFRAIKVRSPKQEAKLNEHHKSLRTLKDLAIRSQNTALLDCWRSYRNLLLSALAAPDALRPYAALLSNKDVHFFNVSDGVAA
jgi:hypothetical protein